MTPEETEDTRERSRLPVALAAGAVVVALLVGGLLLLLRVTQKHGGGAVAEKFPFGAAEQAYAEHIHFRNLQMARATNFLNQEFTYVSGIVSNDGAKTVRGLEVTLEFHDPFNQVILRESEALVSARNSKPLEGGQRRDFQITLEHVPAEWNQQYPSIKASGLLVE